MYVHPPPLIMQPSNPSLSPLQVSQVLSLVASFRRHASDFGVAACYGPQLLEERGGLVLLGHFTKISRITAIPSAPPGAERVPRPSLWGPVHLSPGTLGRLTTFPRYFLNLRERNKINSANKRN